MVLSVWLTLVSHAIVILQRRFPKLGSSTLSNPTPSDLLVRVKVATPAGFTREGADVLTSVNISLEVRLTRGGGGVHMPSARCRATSV